MRTELKSIKTRLFLIIIVFNSYFVSAQNNLIEDYNFETVSFDTIAGPVTTVPQPGMWYPYLTNQNQNVIYAGFDSLMNAKLIGIKTGLSSNPSWLCGLAFRTKAPESGVYRLGFYARIADMDSTASNAYLRVFIRIKDSKKDEVKLFARADLQNNYKDQFLTRGWAYYAIDFDLDKIYNTAGSQILQATNDDRSDFSVYFANISSVRAADIQLANVSLIKLTGDIITDGLFEETHINTSGPNTSIPEFGHWYPYLSSNNQMVVSTVKTPEIKNGNSVDIKVFASSTPSWHSGVAQRISAPLSGIYRLGFYGRIVESTSGDGYIRTYLRVKDRNRSDAKFFSRVDQQNCYKDIFLANDWKYYICDFDLGKIWHNDSVFDSQPLDLIDFALYFSNISSSRAAEIQISDVSFIKIDEIAALYENSTSSHLLKTGKVTLSIDKGAAFIMNIKETAESENWINNSTGLWSMKITSPNGNEYNLSTENCTYMGCTYNDSLGLKSTLTLRWEYSLNNYTCYVKSLISVYRGSDLLHWNFEAKIPDGYYINKLTYPNLKLNKTVNSKIIIPDGGWGAEHSLTDIFTKSQPYPSGSRTMQLLCLQKNEKAFYYATHDVNAVTKFLTVNNQTSNVSVLTETETPKDWTSITGNFVLPWKTCVGIDPEGWIEAVKKWYRPFSYTAKWGRPRVYDNKRPDWLLNNNLWLSTGSPSVDNVNATIRTLNYFNSEYTSCHAYYWHNYDFDTHYPEFLPPKPMFDYMIDTIKSISSHIVPYINGRLWDTTTVYFQEQNAHDFAITNKDGTIRVETYANTPSAVMCPSTLIWKKTLTDLCDTLTNKLNVSGVYIDQVGCSRPYPCWNENHNHTLGGGNFWSNSYRDIISNIKQKIPADAIISTEQNAECYIDLFDIMFMANTPLGNDYRRVPLFQYIYSDRSLMYSLDNYNDRDNYRSLLFKSSLAFLWGSQLGSYQPDFIMNRTLVKHREFVRDLVNFRATQKNIFNGGRLIKELIPTGDNPEIYISEYEKTNVIRGSQWIGANGEEVTYYINFDDKKHNVYLADGQEYELQALSYLRIPVISPVETEEIEYDTVRIENYVTDNKFSQVSFETESGPSTNIPDFDTWYPYFTSGTQGTVYYTNDTELKSDVVGIKVNQTSNPSWLCGLARRISVPEKGVYRLGFYAKCVEKEGSLPAYIRVFLRIDDQNKSQIRCFASANLLNNFKDQSLADGWNYYTVDFDLSKVFLSSTNIQESTDNDISDFSIYFSNISSARAADIRIAEVDFYKVDDCEKPGVWMNSDFENYNYMPYLSTSKADASNSKGLWRLSVPGLSSGSLCLDSTDITGNKSLKINVDSTTGFTGLYIASTLIGLPKGEYVMKFKSKANIDSIPFRIDVNHVNNSAPLFPFNTFATIRENYLTDTLWHEYAVPFDNISMSDSLYLAIRPNISVKDECVNLDNQTVSYWFDDFVLLRPVINQPDYVLPMGKKFLDKYGNDKGIGEESNFTIKQTIGGIIVVSEKTQPIHICNLRGQLLFNKSICGEMFIPLERGLYLINNMKILIM